MTPSVDTSEERQIAALRSEIRQLGVGIWSRRRRRLRRSAFSAALGSITALTGYAVLAALTETGPGWWTPLLLVPRVAGAALLCVGLLGMAGGLLGAASAVIESYRLRERRAVAIASRLAILPSGLGGVALRPLGSEPLRDTRTIAAALTRGLKLHAEVAPAAPPEARGDEAAPA